jgi:hypothetical protein
MTEKGKVPLNDEIDETDETDEIDQTDGIDHFLEDA